MKKLFFMSLILLPALGFAQDNNMNNGYYQDQIDLKNEYEQYANNPLGTGVPKRIAKYSVQNGYKTSEGWYIKPGDTLNIGRGSLQNKDFAFIMARGDGQMDHNFQNFKCIVDKFSVVGNKHIGYKAVAIIKVGKTTRYLVFIESAINAGEIIPPPEYAKDMDKSNKDNLTKADILLKWKKLLDDNGITQQEYDSIKAKLLSGN